MKPLIAAEATTFVLIQKVAKNQVSRNASLPHWALPCKSVKTWAAAFLRCFRSLMPLTSVKAAMPCHYAQPTIVLPAFIRSCSTDGEASPKQRSPHEYY
jgi:hypothetical protein